MITENKERYIDFDSQLLLGNTGIFPERRQQSLPFDQPFRETMRALRPFAKMIIDNKEYNALGDIRTVGMLLADLIPSQMDIKSWIIHHPELIEDHIDELKMVLETPTLRDQGNIPKLSKAIENIQGQKGIIEEIAREKANNILMIRHGFDPKNEADRDKFKRYITAGSRIADELINDERADLRTVWTRTSLTGLTELQEQVKSDDFYRLIRLATNPDATAKIREEATRKAVLMDKAIAAILRIEQANGTMDEVHTVLDRFLWDGERIGEINQRGIIVTHDKLTERVISVKNYDRDKDGEPGSRLPEGENWIQRYYDMPYHKVKLADGTEIPVFMTSRTKEDTATLAKLLLKNGELPDDVRGIRFVVENVDQAKILTQSIIQAFDKAGWRLIPKKKNQTLSLTGEFSIQLPDGNIYSFTLPEKEHNQAKSSAFGVLQFDAEPTAATLETQHTFHPMKQFETQIFTIETLLNSQRECEVDTKKPNFHAGYVYTKRGFIRRTLRSEQVRDNFYTYLFPDEYIRDIQVKPTDRPGDEQHRILSMIENPNNPIIVPLVEKAHRRLREEEDNRYIPY